MAQFLNVSLCNLRTVLDFFYTVLVFVSPILFPFVLPVWGISLIRKKEKAFNKISGVWVFAFAMLALLIWAYRFFHTPSLQYHPSSKEAIGDSLFILIPLFIYYFGVYLFYKKNIWIKTLGILLISVGFLVFLYCFIAKCLVGS